MVGEIEIGRETGVGERERERERQGRKRRSDRGEREKITNTKKFTEFYLVVLQSGYQRQGGKEKDRKRDGLGEREKYITRGTEIYKGEDRNGPVPL